MTTPTARDIADRIARRHEVIKAHRERLTQDIAVALIASRAAALEEAAKVAEQTYELKGAYRRAGAAIAFIIRDLASKEPTP
jgi:hypothetical protein